MHGLFFTFAIDYLEERFGLDVLDDVLEGLELMTEGAYTAVGNYPTLELLAIVSGVTDRVAMPTGRLMQDLGEALICALHLRHPEAFDGVDNTLDFISRVHEHIHIAVRQRYPGTNPPELLVSREDGLGRIQYRSERPLADLAIGMLRGCTHFFGSKDRIDIVAVDEQGFSAELHLHDVEPRAESA